MKPYHGQTSPLIMGLLAFALLGVVALPAAAAPLHQEEGSPEAIPFPAEVVRRTEATAALNASLQEFFERYYAARTQGDREAVAAMTDDGYRVLALDTLSEDTATSFSDVRVEWWYIPPPSGPTGSDPEQRVSFSPAPVIEGRILTALEMFEILGPRPFAGPIEKDTVEFGGWEFALSIAPEPTPTVIANRAGVRQGVAFRVRRAGESWRIVDARLPALGHWLSEPPPATAGFPAELEASLQAHMQRFYRARSFQGRDPRLGFGGVPELMPELAGTCTSVTYCAPGGAGDLYRNYVLNVISQSRARSQQFEIQDVQVLQWMPRPDGTGVAEVLVRRALIEVDDAGNETTSTGDARLRVRWASYEPGGPSSWLVVDGYLQQEAAWVSSMAWSGLMFSQA